MYGNHKHYSILKEELLDSISDGGHRFNPHEMYSAEVQKEQQVSEETPKIRQSVRSNAFNRNGRQFESLTDGNEDFHGSDESDSLRLQVRHIDDRGLISGINSELADGRSISSNSFSSDSQKTQVEEPKTENKSEDGYKESREKGSIHITHNYSVKTTSDLVTKSTPAAVATPSAADSEDQISTEVETLSRKYFSIS